MGGWWPIVIIALAIALVIGPIFWLRPTDRQRRLASMRQHAAKQGLIVQMSSVPPACGDGSAAFYIARWGDARKLHTGWSLAVQRMSHEMHFDGKWDWVGRERAPEGAWPILLQLLNELPADAVALSAFQAGLGIQWREIGGETAVQALEASLAKYRPEIEATLRPRSQA